jgi:uncharacterized protein (TIGR04255 family)
MNWEPSRADHSIDRATVSIALAKPLDANTFDELVIAGRKVAATQLLTDRVDLVDPIELTAGASATIDMSMPPRRVVFRRLDADKVSVDELSIGVHRIAIGTLRYRRWADFFGLFTSSLQALEASYPITQNIRVARLEYVDRFNSTILSADHFEVINRKSEFLAPAVASKTAALHVHSGWFDYETPDIRKLTNVNIDVNDASVPPPPDPRRTISVLSIGQFEALNGTLDKTVERLNTLHDYLKSTFGETITVEAANRVSLND